MIKVFICKHALVAKHEVEWFCTFLQFMLRVRLICMQKHSYFMNFLNIRWSFDLHHIFSKVHEEVERPHFFAISMRFLGNSVTIPTRGLWNNPVYVSVTSYLVAKDLIFFTYISVRPILRTK